MASTEAKQGDVSSAVDTCIENVRTRTLDLSFNELLDMFANDELQIQPEYQRLFRWSEGRQSRFIESLILEMPIPPIFVIERDEGVYELIDGLQRMSSYLHFRGKHPERRDESGAFESLKLSECDIVPALNGLSFEDLPSSLQIRLKRCFVRVEVIRRESDARLRYYMFKRLNTGGEELSDQEIRNCTVRLLDPAFNEFIADLSEYENFIECTKVISESEKEKKFDQELVLRFFAFKNYRENYVHEVGEFMTDYMEVVSDPENESVNFDYDKERTTFCRTFNVLAASLRDKAFTGFKRNNQELNRFLSYHYEAIALGIQPYLSKLDPANAAQMTVLREKLTSVKQDGQFLDLTQGGGKNYRGPLENRITFVSDAVAKLFS